MITANVKRVGLSVGVFAVALSAACLAAAAPTAPAGNDAPKAECQGKHGDKKPGARFERADANKDGFLTQAEVGEKRWQKVQVADSNKDGKVSKAEIVQARKDGKMGHRGQKHEKKS